MPRQPRQRTKANLAYFVNKMIDMFNNTNIRTVVSPNEALLPEVYNDNNTSNDFKWNKTIDYLNTNLNDYANQNDILKFWSNINDELVQSSPQKTVLTPHVLSLKPKSLIMVKKKINFWLLKMYTAILEFYVIKLKKQVFEHHK